MREQGVRGVNDDLSGRPVRRIRKDERHLLVVGVDQEQERVVDDPFADFVAVGDAAAVEEDRKALRVPARAQTARLCWLPTAWSAYTGTDRVMIVWTRCGMPGMPMRRPTCWRAGEAGRAEEAEEARALWRGHPFAAAGELARNEASQADAGSA